jgi:two-component system, cell cycle sensor histidine kinase and response regulator CckA
VYTSAGMEPRDAPERMFVFALDRDGHCIAGDPATLEALGLGDHTGLASAELVAMASEAIASGVVRRLTGVPVAGDGTKTVDIAAHPITDDIRSLAVITVADCSKEERIARTLARYRLIERVTRAAYWEWDVATGEMWWNDLHYELLGYDQDSTTPSFDAWRQRIHPDDADRVIGRVEAVLASTAIEYRDEYRYLLSDGAITTVDDRGYIERSGDGRPLRMLGAMHDVTTERAAERSLRESEERFRQIAGTIREVFWLTDLEHGKVLYVSPAFETIFGRSVQWLQDQPFAFLDAVHPGDRDRVVRGLDRLRAGAIYEEIFRIVRPDGTTAWLHDRATPVPSSDGRPKRATGVTLDITLQRRLEERLSFTQRMESMGRLAAGIAHDFNNLLSVIIGSAAIAQENVATGRTVAQDIDVIREAATRAVGLTQQLLSFARSQPLPSTTFDLNASIEGLDRLLRLLVGDSIEVEYRLASARMMVRGDPTQIEQVLVNLATNARDSMDGGGRLTLATQEVSIGASESTDSVAVAPGEYVSLTVHDTGHGIPPEHRDRIFEPFFSTKASGSGTGLGLAICYGIVRQAGGEISVRSPETGEGTTFEVLLPRV